MGLAEGYIYTDGHSSTDDDKEAARRLLSFIIEIFRNVDKKSQGPVDVTVLLQHPTPLRLTFGV